MVCARYFYDFPSKSIDHSHHIKADKLNNHIIVKCIIIHDYLHYNSRSSSDWKMIM